MAYKETDTFFLVSLSGLDGDLSTRHTNSPATLTREDIFLTLSVYSLTRYAQQIRRMCIYHVSGDLLCQEVVLYCPSYQEAETVLQQIISLILREVEPFPAFAALSPTEKLLSAIFHRWELSLFMGSGSVEHCQLVAEKCYALQRSEIQEIVVFEGTEAYSAFAASWEEISHVELLTV